MKNGERERLRESMQKGYNFQRLILLLLFFYCARVVRYIRRVRELRRGPFCLRREG